MKKVPAYIIKDVERLNKYLNMVDNLSREIETWVEENTDADGMDFFYDNHLDNPFEFNANYTIGQLNELVEGE